ncbi:MAG: HAD family hydrolase [Aliishimia sp.]
MNIAMWSGPRNLSTAMMYSFGARADFNVVDEPFYGAYLKLTGSDHPVRDEIIAAMETNPELVAADLKTSGYVKHMTQHMVPGIPRTWFRDVKHAFLIRHPARVVASYHVKREKPVLEDIGFRQQAEIFQEVRALGQTPIVVDSFDIRTDPETMLRKLCGALDIPWDSAMLSWPKGGHSSDGVWAKHWYGAVHTSTSFAAPEGALPVLEPDLQEVADAAMPHYEALAAFKI